MIKIFLSFFILTNFLFSQDKYKNKDLIIPEYIKLREKIVSEVNITIDNNIFEAKKSFTSKSDNIGYIALTFDACDKGYNKELVNYLISENIPATFFLSGKWIDNNIEIFKEISKNPLFEIENHGLKHRICALGDEGKYKLKNTKTLSEMIDEIELNNRKIEILTGRRPIFYRPAGAYIDNICTKIAQKLSMEIAGYDTLTGDSFSKTSAKEMSDRILKNAKHGMVVLMHLNHPERNEVQALKIAIPILKKRGFSFCHLEDFSLSQ